MKRGAIFGDLKPKGSSRFFHKNHTEYQLRETAPLRKARVGKYKIDGLMLCNITHSWWIIARLLLEIVGK